MGIHKDGFKKFTKIREDVKKVCASGSFAIIQKSNEFYLLIINNS